jgi:hypothetical protein
MEQQRGVALSLRRLGHGGQFVAAAHFPRNLADLPRAPELIDISPHSLLLEHLARLF